MLEDYNKVCNLSQEEIEQIMRELEEQKKINNSTTPIYLFDPDEYEDWMKQTKDTLPEKKSGCITHKWKSYTGLKEVYEFCEVCNQKRP